MPKFTDTVHQHVANGVQAFNRGDFYEAHEHFESAWRAVLDDTREFFRALLLISGGFFRLTQNRSDAAKKFFTNALGWLLPFPDHYSGFDVSNLKAYLQILIDHIDQSTSTGKIIEDYFQPLMMEHPEDNQQPNPKGR